MDQQKKSRVPTSFTSFGVKNAKSTVMSRKMTNGFFKWAVQSKASRIWRHTKRKYEMKTDRNFRQTANLKIFRFFAGLKSEWVGKRFLLLVVDPKNFDWFSLGAANIHTKLQSDEYQLAHKNRLTGSKRCEVDTICRTWGPAGTSYLEKNFVIS